MDVRTSPVTGFATLGILTLRGTIMSDGSFRSAGQSYGLDSSVRLITGDSIVRLMAEIDEHLTMTGAAVSTARVEAAVRKAQRQGGRIAGLAVLLPVDQFVRKPGWGLSDAAATTLIAKVEAYAASAESIAA